MVDNYLRTIADVASYICNQTTHIRN